MTRLEIGFQTGPCTNGDRRPGSILLREVGKVGTAIYLP